MSDDGLDTTPDIGFARKDAIDPDRTVLVVIDLTYGNATRDYGLCRSLQEAEHGVDYYADRVEQVVVPNVARLTAAARDAGLKVIYLQNGSEFEDYRDVHRNLRPVYEAWGQRRGQKEFEIVEAVAPTEGDLVLTKVSSGAWAGTNIDNILRFREVDHVIVCGVATNGCVLTTALGGWDKGFAISVVEDACATTGQRVHDNAIEVMRDYGMPILSTADAVSRIQAPA